jgi:hypothetical protein
MEFFHGRRVTPHKNEHQHGFKINTLKYYVVYFIKKV